MQYSDVYIRGEFCSIQSKMYYTSCFWSCDPGNLILTIIQTDVMNLWMVFGSAGEGRLSPGLIIDNSCGCHTAKVEQVHTIHKSESKYS